MIGTILFIQCWTSILLYYQTNLYLKLFLKMTQPKYNIISITFSPITTNSTPFSHHSNTFPKLFLQKFRFLFCKNSLVPQVFRTPSFHTIELQLHYIQSHVKIQTLFPHSILLPLLSLQLSIFQLPFFYTLQLPPKSWYRGSFVRYWAIPSTTFTINIHVSQKFQTQQVPQLL